MEEGGHWCRWVVTGAGGWSLVQVGGAGGGGWSLVQVGGSCAGGWGWCRWVGGVKRQPMPAPCVCMTVHS